MDILYNDLTTLSQKIIQDDKIKIPLKEHQKTAIYAMIKFESNGIISFVQDSIIKDYRIYSYKEINECYYWRTGFKEKCRKMNIEIETNYGILADKVGSGKTFEIMGLIVYGQMPKERDKILSSSVYSVLKYKDTKKTIKTNLIIVPHNIIIQWKDTFKLSTLKTHIIAKHIDVDFLEFEENIFENEPAIADADFNEKNCIEYYDTIIISATMFDYYYEKFKEIKYARIIIDEIVSIKLPTNLEFNCNFLWFLTATPTGIKTIRRNYIRYIVSNMSDYVINNIIVKNNNEYIDESMKLPSIKQITIKCLTPKQLKMIKGYVDNEIMTMLNAGNIQEAVIKLNCNIDTSDSILEVITKKIKKELHNKKQELEYEQKRIPDDTKIHEERIKKLELKIVELESKCSGIEARVKSFKEENCPICFDELELPMLTPCCNNLFCVKCLTNCRTCPMCREKINLATCLVIDDKQEKEKKVENKLCLKIDNLITIIKSNPNGKFIVFSNYDKTFDNINKKLSENNIVNSRLVGSNIVINNIIKRFEKGEIKVLMLNALNYGSGINLQMASDIIIYHELDIELETQVIGRAQRLGRTTELNVYYLLNDNEKVNCNSPTLNMDIFDDNKSMLDEFINSNIPEKVQKTKKSNNSDDILEISKKNKT